MKTLQILFVMLGICISNVAQAQEENKTNETKTQKKEMNLMDEQAKILGSLFGDMEEDIDGTKDPFKNVKSYEDLLNKSKLDPEMKVKLLAMYKLYDQSLDPKQKDSLKVSLEKLFIESTKKPNKN